MNSLSSHLLQAVHRLDYLMSKIGLPKNSSENMLTAYFIRQTSFSTQGRLFFTSFNPAPMPGFQKDGTRLTEVVGENE